MNKLSLYITEKLKINKNSKIDKFDNLIKKITRISDENILNFIYTFLEDNNNNLDEVNAYYSARHFPEYILNDLDENELKHVHKINALDFPQEVNNYFNLDGEDIDEYLAYGNRVFDIYAKYENNNSIVYIKYLDNSLKVFFINY